MSPALNEMSNNMNAYIPKNAVYRFDGTNYETWSFKMKTRLRGERLWSLVNGTRPRPAKEEKVEATAKAKGSTRNVDDNDQGKDEPEDDWDQENDEAIALI